MIKIDHNNKSIDSMVIATLGDLYRFVEAYDLPAARRAEIRSAIKRTDELVGHGALDLGADPLKLFAALDQYSPAMAGMSGGAFANMKSRLRAALKVGRPHLVSTRSVRLEGAWLALNEQLAAREQHSLSRFLRYACVTNWEVSEIADDHVERFAAHLRDEAMAASWEKTVRETIRTWNGLVARYPALDLKPLTPPAPKRVPYWIDLAILPETMQADLEAFRTFISTPAKVIGKTRQRLKAGTIQQYHHGIRMLLSALVAAGEDIASMTRLRDVLTAAQVEKALIYLSEDRFDQRVTSGMIIMASRARKIAAWAKLPAEALAEIDSLISDLKVVAPRVKGLTIKNRALLDRLDDPRFRDLIYLLPHTLVRKARQHRHPYRAATLVRAAVAIELLLTCSMRRENLVSLELEQNIRRIGNGRDARWVIEFEQQDVKNEEPLRYILPRETAELLEDYRHHWRPVLSEAPTPWLFPAPDGSRVDERGFAGDIARKPERELGEPVTPHQFRHISAELYLLDNPDNLAVVSSHLGHRDINTTRTYYARKKQREASRMYQERLGLGRSQAAERVRGRARRKTPLDVFRKEDIL